MAIRPRIILEDVILSENFYQATEQEGVYLEQPEPDEGNSGSLRPVSISDVFANMSINASISSGDQDTIFRLVNFDIFGDDYFNGCTMRAMKQFVDDGDTGHLPVGEGALPVTTEKKFGTHGIYFNGTTDYIEVADHDDVNGMHSYGVASTAPVNAPCRQQRARPPQKRLCNSLD